MEENTNIEIDTAKILKKIYTNIFCSFEEQYIIVFLCGGASADCQPKRPPVPYSAATL